MLDYRYVALFLACFFCIAIIDYRTELFIEKSGNDILSKENQTLFNLNQTGLESVEECVPHFAYIKEQVENSTAFHGRYRRTFHLTASYEYSTHIVVTMQSEAEHNTPVFCRYLDTNFIELGEPLPSTLRGMSAIYCCRRANARYMSITLNDTQPVNQWTRLIDRTEPEYKYELSLCLAPIFGNESTWLLLAETIEHYKIQGVQHFYLYIKEMDDYSRHLVEDYIRTGEVEVVWLDYREDRNKALRQYTSVEDCLDRARFHSKYAIFADLDERIMPTSSNETLLELVRSEFSKDNKTGGIRFRPRWVFRDKPVPQVFEGSSTLNESLPTLVFHNTSQWPTSPDKNPKMIIEPTKVIRMWVHWVDVYAPGYETAEVEPERAVMRHYRSLSAGNFSETKIMQDTVTYGKYEYTDYRPDLMGKLYDNILRRLNHVYSKRLILGHT